MKRRKYICANWKMNKTSSEAITFIEDLNKFEFKNVDVLIAPSFVSLETFRRNVKDGVEVAAQNVSQYESGAYTGEISTSMLKDIGAKSVIIGHSERRDIFNESNEVINAKLKRTLADNLKAILCLGESREIREEGGEIEFVKNQLLESLKDIEDIKSITIAYEPIWAIGTGKTCSADDAEKMCMEIRNAIYESYKDISKEIRILYGGSVKPENATEILSKENIDGVLVGGASLKSDDFIEIIKAGESLWNL